MRPRSSGIPGSVIYLALFSFFLVVLFCNAASAVVLSAKYVGNVIVDLSWTKDDPYTGVFTKYKLFRNGDLLETFFDRNMLFYRDEGLTKGVTYTYRIDVYDDKNAVKETHTQLFTTGEVRGEIILNTTWTKGESPYNLAEDVTVANAHLTIEPEVTVNWRGPVNNWVDSFLITVNGGKLTARTVTFKEGRITIASSTGSLVKGCTLNYTGTLYWTPVFLTKSQQCIFSGNTIQGYPYGFKLADANLNTLDNNTVSGGGYRSLLDGISLERSDNNTLTGNNVSNGDIEVYDNSDHNTLTGNTITHGGFSVWNSDHNQLIGNTAKGSVDQTPASYIGSTGIALSTAHHNTLVDNTTNANPYNGIILHDSSNNTLKGNTSSFNRGHGITNGIYLKNASNDNILTGNTLNQNNGNGICIEGSVNNSVSGSFIFNNLKSGIHLDKVSKDNTLQDNIIAENNRYGLLLEDGSGPNTITGNRVSRHGWGGIKLLDCFNNTIWNNAFSNGMELNASDNGINFWNKAKTDGKNIVGGPFTGGNYWDGYQGKDNDGDGLGDTDLPFNGWGMIQNGGDSRPLIIQDPVVNSPGDDKDADPGDGRCDTGKTVAYQTPECTFRAAIETANAKPGSQTISFDIPGSGVPTILPDTPLPEITAPVVLDGSTQPSSARVELNGSNAGEDASGFFITGGASTVKGFAINRFKKHGIYLYQGLGSKVVNNYIGTTAQGGAAKGIGNLGNGIMVHLSSKNRIGGSSPDERNIISGNSNGIEIRARLDGNPLPALTGHNEVVGNFIGTDSTGMTANGNLESGISIIDAPNTTIGGLTGTTPGGPCTGDCNLISGNGIAIATGHGDGISIHGSQVKSTLIYGNYIGTNTQGTGILKNRLNGINITYATETLIGSGQPEGRNLISGNGLDGIRFNFKKTTPNRVKGNYIGTNAMGNAALPNSDNGVAVLGAPGTTIGGVDGTTPGGPCTGDCNLISGNGWAGVYVAGEDAKAVKIQGNFIGTDVSGKSKLAFPGTERSNIQGVKVSGSGGPTIGGRTANARNLISGNTTGIDLEYASNVAVLGNFIGTDTAGISNLGNEIGIRSYTPFGCTIGGLFPTNGTCTGDCNLISGNGTGILIQGGLDYQEVYGNYIGTNMAGNDNADGTLANGKGIVIERSKAYIGDDTGTKKNLISGNREHNILITGNSSKNSYIQGNFIGTDDTGKNKLKGSIAKAPGIEISDGAHTNTVGGSVGTTPGGPCTGPCNVIAANGDQGIKIEKGGNNTIQGNYIGLDATGKVDFGNTGNGIEIKESDKNIIGGTSISERNLISGNGGSGFYFFNSSHNEVKGNFIGTDVSGKADFGNDVNGIELSGAIYVMDSKPIKFARHNKIGVAEGNGCNVISGNGGNGINVSGDGWDNSLSFNYIGLGNDFVTAIPNQGSGISFGTNTKNNRAEWNTVSHNCSGIEDYGETNTIENNIVTKNKCATGIVCDGCSADITGNRIEQDDSHGIRCENGAAPVIRENSLMDNKGNGLMNNNPANPVDAEKNWWGDSSGPSGAGPGSGDEVSTGVDFTPWLTVPSVVAVIAGPDPLAIARGRAASGYAQFKNWQTPGDIIDVTVSDTQGWLTSAASFSVTLNSTTGGSADLDFSVPVAAAVGDTSVVTVTAVSQSEPLDTASDSFTVTAGAAADLVVTKTGPVDAVKIGERIQYVITVVNNGPDKADNVLVVDELPQELTFDSAASNPGTCQSDGTIVSCDIGGLSQGGNATITITTVAASAGTVHNSVRLLFEAVETDAGNNTASVQTKIVSGRILRIDTGTGGGSVQGDTVTCPGECMAVYIDGQSVTLSASPEDGFTFDGWSGDVTGTDPVCSFIMDSDKRVTAYFLPEEVSPIPALNSGGHILFAAAMMAFGLLAIYRRKDNIAK